MNEPKTLDKLNEILKNPQQFRLNLTQIRIGHNLSLDEKGVK